MAMPWAYNGETREYVATPCPAVEVNDLANSTEVYGRYICSWIGEKKPTNIPRGSSSSEKQTFGAADGVSGATYWSRRPQDIRDFLQN